MRDNLLILNRDQYGNETDTFTIGRYKLFTKDFPQSFPLSGVYGSYMVIAEKGR